jgi:hypothetical protein
VVVSLSVLSAYDGRRRQVGASLPQAGLLLLRVELLLSLALEECLQTGGDQADFLVDISGDPVFQPVEAVSYTLADFLRLRLPSNYKPFAHFPG